MPFSCYDTLDPDFCPVLDHFGSGSIAFQRMLIQEVPGKIFLLPVWPKTWDVNFKLHALKNTIVQGEVKNGKIINIKVTPESRRKDIVFRENWKWNNNFLN